MTRRMEAEPEGFVEKIGEALNVIELQVEGDVRRFKKFIESRGAETGAWRGDVNPGGA